MAAEQGNPTTQFELGRSYANGQGVKQDYAEALVWYRKAAEQGLADAQCNIGIMYDRGQSVRQDYAEALVWYRRAAEQGHAHAQCNIGVIYEYGQSVATSDILAYVWYTIALSSFDASNLEDRAAIVRSQSRVTEILTQEELLGATRFARQWKTIDKPWIYIKSLANSCYFISKIVSSRLLPQWLSIFFPQHGLLAGSGSFLNSSICRR